MSLRNSLKLVFFAVAASPPRLRARIDAATASGAVTVLNLHRVDDRQQGAYRSLSPRLFDEWLGWLATEFAVVTFSELERTDRPRKPPLVLSFDDGYKDFIDVVAPILAKHGLRANQNVIPGCVESGLPPINVLVQDFIAAAPAKLLRELVIPGAPAPVDPERRASSALRASAALKNRPIAEQKAIFAQLKPLFERFAEFRATPMMCATEIREVGVTHEIGVHSFEHASMAAESDAYLVEDARRCREWLHTMLGREPRIYAFPNGSLRDGQIELVRRQDYATVLLVGETHSRLGTIAHPRFTFHANSLAEARYRATGGRMNLRPASLCDGPEAHRCGRRSFGRKGRWGRND
jgi:peptidoglycan/xylan/chitin deacetylase (PgdA/CDA1 family)